MAIAFINAATIKRTFEFDQLLLQNVPRSRRELKNKIHDKDSNESSSEESKEKDIEGSGINVPKMELVPGRKIHIGSNEGSGLDLDDSNVEGSGSDI
uniref:Uncharacterized protein n=1 Tax=Parastrongyloides trichosuri TaxID=131310 RepID=A0A0N4ZRF5_PARTI